MARAAFTRKMASELGQLDDLGDRDESGSELRIAANQPPIARSQSSEPSEQQTALKSPGARQLAIRSGVVGFFDGVPSADFRCEPGEMLKMLKVSSGVVVLGGSRIFTPTAPCLNRGGDCRATRV